MSREDAHGSILSRWGVLCYHHTYSSFSIARNDFAKKLVDQSQARIINYLDMQNNLSAAHTKLTTADHDGLAVLIELE